MKKSLIALTLLAPLTFTLTGCVVAVDGNGDGDGHFSRNFEDREYDNRKAITRLALRSNINDAQSSLGVADFNETYEVEGQVVKVLYYRTHRIHKDGITTKDECTYLKFVDGVLVETGNGADYSRN